MSLIYETNFVYEGSPHRELIHEPHRDPVFPRGLDFFNFCPYKSLGLGQLYYLFVPVVTTQLLTALNFPLMLLIAFFSEIHYIFH